MATTLGAVRRARWTAGVLLALTVVAGCSAPDRSDDPGLRAQIEAVPPVDLRGQDNPTRDPRVVSALWDGSLLRRATPIDARPMQRGAATASPEPARPLLTVTAQQATPGFVGALPVRDPRTADFAAGVTGRLFFTVDGTPRTCTAAVVGSGTGSVLATAGHCLLSTGDGGPRQPSQNLMFVPGDRDGGGPLGRWFAADVTVTDGWARRQDWSQDVGFVRLRDRGDGVRLQQLVGALGARFGVPGPATLTVLGYPAAGGFDGSELVTCRQAGGGPPDPVDPAALAVTCAMTAGYSGGPWTEPGQPAELLAVSSHDYGDGHLYGARLGAGALEAFRRADVPS